MPNYLCWTFYLFAGLLVYPFAWLPTVMTVIFVLGIWILNQENQFFAWPQKGRKMLFFAIFSVHIDSCAGMDPNIYWAQYVFRCMDSQSSGPLLVVVEMNDCCCGDKYFRAR